MIVVSIGLFLFLSRFVHFSYGSFLIACLINIKAHTYFEKTFKALKVSIFAQRCIFAQREQVKLVPPKELQLSVSIGNFLVYYDVTNRKL